MVELAPEQESQESTAVTLHYSFYHVIEKVKKWLAKFPQSIDPSIMNDLYLVYLLAQKKYLDHRNFSHLHRLVLSIHLMQKKLLNSSIFFSKLRHIEVRWFNALLNFPFSNPPVLGCLIGYNCLKKYELLDEENIILILQKSLPELRLVKESIYHHQSQHKNLKMFYFEVEKKDGVPFTLKERILLKNTIEEKVKNSIQTLFPENFIANNEEEIYKTILMLSQQIQYLHDLPQVSINLDQLTTNEVIFQVTIVYISPFHRFSLKDCFFSGKFVSDRVLTVKQMGDHPVEAHLFRVHLPRDTNLLKADSSLDFYTARQQVANNIKMSIGAFRDHNGGIIVKQQELLQNFKDNFPKITKFEPDVLEAFFFTLMPLEKQATLDLEVLSKLFNQFLDSRNHELTQKIPYIFKVLSDNDQTFVLIQANIAFKKALMDFLNEQNFKTDIAYNIIETKDNIFLNFVFLQGSEIDLDASIQIFKQLLYRWHQKLKNKQELRVALEYSFVSFDPRIGGEGVSYEILKLLFEGLTRYSQNGTIEKAIADTIQISPDGKNYTFKLKPTFWSDGSSLTAHDFEYAWKKVLSPTFKTAFAYIFYPIKNAKKAKEGKVPLKSVGISAVDDHTLKVELENPTPYFLELTSRPLYSPVHRLIDKQYPQWPYESEKNYPCNGPFMLKINQPHQGFQLVKNPLYCDADQITLEKINLTYMNSLQAYHSFQRREVDWIGNPFGPYNSFYDVDAESQIASIMDVWVCWLSFNTKKAPFNSPKFRQAFSYAIQRSKIITNDILSLKPAYSLFPFHQNQKTDLLFPKFDREIARKLFDEALDELELELKDLPHITFVYHEKGVQSFVAPLIQEQLKKCFGIECELKPLPWNELFTHVTNGDFQITLINWSSWTKDQLYTLNAFRLANQEINPSKWEDAQFQKLLSLAEQESDSLKRAVHLKEAAKILYEQMPAIPLFYQSPQALVHKNLYVPNHNYKSPIDFFNLSRSYWFNKEI